MSIGDVTACRYIVCVYCVPSRDVGRLKSAYTHRHDMLPHHRWIKLPFFNLSKLTTDRS